MVLVVIFFLFHTARVVIYMRARDMHKNSKNKRLANGSFTPFCTCRGFLFVFEGKHGIFMKSYSIEELFLLTIRWGFLWRNVHSLT